MLNNHLVLLLLADRESPQLGLHSLVLPLRSSALAAASLHQVVLVGPAEYIAREWAGLANLPRLLVLDGDPRCRADLRAVNINLARLVVVLSAGPSQQAELADTEAVLTSLNIRTMTFTAGEVGGLLCFPSTVV